MKLNIIYNVKFKCFSKLRFGWLLTLAVYYFSEILKNYSVLRNDASEEALREFLAVFKQHADQVNLQSIHLPNL